jgi:hypothetical protein
MSTLTSDLRAPFANRRFDWTWISLGLYLALAAWWLRLALEAGPRVVRPYYTITYLLTALIFAAGLVAFARSHTSGQRVVALQASLVLSPGTGLLVSYLFWSLPGLSHGPGATTLTLLLVYAAFSLPWLLLMFVPGLLTAARRALSPKRARWSIDWRLAGLWTLATTAGWLLPHLISIADWPVQVASAWLLMLTAPAVLQGLVLRRRLHGAGWQTLAGWVAVSAAGLIGGAYLMASRQLLDLYLNGRDGLDQVLGYSTLGAALGVAQWLVLRRWTPRAHGWVLASLLAWPAGWGLAQLVGVFWSGPKLGGVEPALIAGLAGLMTGAALGWLLPRRESDSA